MPPVVLRQVALRLATAASLTGALLALTACEESHLRLQPDFGTSVRADVAGQIADPDAHYLGTPAAASDGARASLAQTRYRTDKVIPPVNLITSEVAGSSGGNGSGGGGGGPPQ
jgi:hypothetical protein